MPLLQSNKLLVLVLLINGISISINAQTARNLPHTYTAFTYGEKLTYTLQFGSISAGQATFSVDPTATRIAGSDHFHLHIEGKSNAAFEVFYRVRDVYDSYVDIETLLPSLYIRDIQEGTYVKQERYLFNQSKQIVKSGPKLFNVIPSMHDLVSAFYALRGINFPEKAIGSSLDFKIFFEEEEFALGIKYTGKTVIATRFGNVRVKVFVPILIEGRVFVDQSDMTLYVSDDENQIPILITSKVYLGTVRAELTNYDNLKSPFTSLLAK